MSAYDSRPDTYAHIGRVRQLLGRARAIAAARRVASPAKPSPPARRRMMPHDLPLMPHVEGYIFETGMADGDHADRNRTVCKIIRRLPPDPDGLEPKFLVQFGDGVVIHAYARELSPWYPT